MCASESESVNWASEKLQKPGQAFKVMDGRVKADNSRRVEEVTGAVNEVWPKAWGGKDLWGFGSPRGESCTGSRTFSLMSLSLRRLLRTCCSRSSHSLSRGALRGEAASDLHSFEIRTSVCTVLAKNLKFAVIRERKCPKTA
eukprot:4321569-Pleurochrysis_carterae.AAC.4